MNEIDLYVLIWNDSQSKCKKLVVQQLYGPTCVKSKPNGLPVYKCLLGKFVYDWKIPEVTHKNFRIVNFRNWGYSIRQQENFNFYF